MMRKRLGRTRKAGAWQVGCKEGWVEIVALKNEVTRLKKEIEFLRKLLLKEQSNAPN